MAAYAAVISVMNILDQIQNHPRHTFSFDNRQMKSLAETVDFLVDFLECCSHGESKEAEALERKIASAAYAAEDVIESHVVDQIHSGSTLNGETTSCFLVDLQKVIEDMDSIKKLAMEVKVQRGIRGDLLTIYSKPAASARPFNIGKNVMVSYEDELIQLMERLTRNQSTREIITIVGMGGIGKTTLARNVYERSVVKQHFDVRLWATVSQEFSAEKIMSQLLSCLGESTSGTVHELGDTLHKTLSGRRYLVVLDDIWSMEAWDEIQLLLPQNSNGSSIIITTRQSTMAVHLGSNSFEMKFLDEITSWKLLCEKAFGEEGCPLELEEIGKKIAKNCKGLPLSIVVTGGHLRKSSRMKEYWELVGNDINSILNSEEDEQCLKILSLSYSYLPAHLKPCFLYLGIYLGDQEILVSELIVLWVAEGFVRPNYVQSLEETAEGYLRDLVDRNLILIREWSRTGEFDSCNIHDLLRELCLRIAEKERFFCMLKKNTTRTIHTERRVVIHGDHFQTEPHPNNFHALTSAQLVRSLKCGGCELPFELRLLRVLRKGLCDKDDAFNYCQQVNLSYIHTDYIACLVHLPSSISRLWNLQTLKISGTDMQVFVPSEIWEMPQLRHLELQEFFLPDPPPCNDKQGEFVLENLQTLSIVTNLSMSDEVCKRIPNIKKLAAHYHYEASSYSFSHNFGRFHKLVSLELNYFYRACDFALTFTLPSSLRELSLQRCYLDWDDLTMIGSLPCLELLRLGYDSVEGPEWNPTEGEFARLKYLEIFHCKLLRWNADSSHFPVLEHLSVSYLDALEEFPSAIGDVPTLGVIHLQYCSMSAAISAVETLVEQESLGNEGLQVNVRFLFKKQRKSFKKKLGRKGLRSKNLFIHPAYV